MELYSTLPQTFLFVLLELVLGSAISLLAIEPRLEVGAGFLQFMGVSILGTLLLAAWVNGSIWAAPAIGGLADLGVGRPIAGAVAAAALYSLFSFWPRRAPRIAAGLALAGASGLALVIGLAAYAPAAAWAAPVAVVASFAAAALAMGGSMTGMLLGHWYLVAPMLSSQPLLRITALFLVGLVAQAGILLWITLLGGGGVGPLAVMIGMRAAFGILFPLVMGAFVWYACRIRAMRTATGILYLAVGCVVIGDITAKVVYFLTAMPV